MFSSKRKWILVGLSVLAAATLLGFVLTRSTANPILPKKNAAEESSEPTKKVDTSPLDTAHKLSDVPSTSQEQRMATEAARVADDEVDLAFAQAMQRAQQQSEVEKSQSGEIKDLKARIGWLENQLQILQQQSERLTKLAATPGGDNLGVRQQLELAQARITLLNDRLDDARQDLVRSGGDPEAQVSQELQEHEAQEHASGAASVPQPKPQSFAVEGSLVSEFRAWQRLRQNRKRLQEAQQQAEVALKILTGKHKALAQGATDSLDTDDLSAAPDDAEAAAPTDQTQHATAVAKLHDLSQNAKSLAQYDKRIEAEQRLANLYGQWSETLNAQMRLVEHVILRSLLWVMLVLLALVLIDGLVERFYAGLGPERRRLGTPRLVLRFVTQVIGVLVILLALFGLPSQLSTVLALAGAGLTVALKDFIVAFFGWFVLMGSHGIRVGDWVEINGIGGEVTDIGFLHTILLETGAWTDVGHPTGREVSFVNSFAIEGHYFNFTTTGQWLWDELDVLIPAGEDPFRLTKSVLELTTEQTKADSALAEEEWRRATRNTVVQSFSAAPAINLRPTHLGVSLVVRYIVHAHDRYQVRTKLYHGIVEQLEAGRQTNAGPENIAAKP